MTGEDETTNEQAAREQDQEDPSGQRKRTGQDPEKGSTPGTDVRPAGTRKMDMPPKDWSKTDEEADASFPASDPPGNY